MPKSSNKKPSFQRQRAPARTRRTTQRRAQPTTRANSQTVTLPAAITTPMRPYFNQSVRNGVTTIRGRDLVVTEIINRGLASSIARIPLSPRIWSGTRLAIVASTFMSHRPKKVILHYQPSVGSSANGNIYYGAFTPDTAFHGGNITRTQSLIATGGGSTPIWCPLSADINLDGLQKPWYDCEGMDSESIPLVIYFAAGNVTDNSVCGSAWIEYEWTFTRPCVGQTALSGVSQAYDMIPRSVACQSGSGNFTISSDNNYPLGTEIIVTPSTNVSVPLSELNTGGTVVGNMINTGLDFAADMASTTFFNIKNEVGRNLYAQADSAAWAFLSRAIAGALIA